MRSVERASWLGKNPGSVGSECGASVVVVGVVAVVAAVAIVATMSVELSEDAGLPTCL